MREVRPVLLLWPQTDSPVTGRYEQPHHLALSALVDPQVEQQRPDLSSGVSAYPEADPPRLNSLYALTHLQPFKIGCAQACTLVLRSNWRPTTLEPEGGEQPHGE